MASDRMSVRSLPGLIRSGCGSGQVLASLLCEELFYLRSELLLQLLVELAACRRGESGMDPLHQAITTNEDGSRPSIEIDRLRHLLPHLSGCARNQVGVFHAVLLHESTFPRQASLLLRLFEVQSDDCEAFVAILLV